MNTVNFKTLQEIFRAVYSYTEFTYDYIFKKDILKKLTIIFDNETSKIKSIFNFFKIFTIQNKLNYYLYKIICKYVNTNTSFSNSVYIKIPNNIKKQLEDKNIAFFNNNNCFLTFIGLAYILTNKLYNLDLQHDRKELCDEIFLFVLEACNAKKDIAPKVCLCYANTDAAKHFNFKLLNILDSKSDNYSFEEHLINQINASVSGIYVRRYDNWNDIFLKSDFENLFEKLKNNGIITEYFINNSGNYELNKEETSTKISNTLKDNITSALSKAFDEMHKKIGNGQTVQLSVSSAVAIDENGNVINIPVGEMNKNFNKDNKVNENDEKNLDNLANEIKQIIENNSCLRYINYNSILKKNMYYNENIENDIVNIQKLIKPTKYKSAIKELKNNNLGTGISCMLYGEPGTGKTETVLQIAKDSKRDIIQVDLSQVESKWVGESSKNIQSIFDTYKEILDISHKQKKNIPILLLNECDGFISKRLTDISGEAAKESNTGANIILENLEKFEGIIFLTTNLVNNLDDALDRRLLYKINLEKPDEKTRKKLWKNKINKLSTHTIELLAKEYKFSGAQIDNVFKKFIIDYIITTKKDYSYDVIKKYCDNEIAINKKENIRPIGFN